MIFWGKPPQIASPDALFHIESAINIVDLPANYYNSHYPPLYSRILSLLYFPNSLYFKITHPNSPQFPSAIHFYIARLLSLFFHILAIIVLKRLSLLLRFTDKQTFISSILFTFSILPFRYSIYAVPESLNILLSLLSIFLFYYYKNNFSFKAILLISLLIALTLSTKLNFVILIVLLFISIYEIIEKPKFAFLKIFKIAIISNLFLLIIYPSFYLSLWEISNNSINTISNNSPSINCEGSFLSFLFGKHTVLHEVYGYRSITKTLTPIIFIISILMSFKLLKNNIKIFLPLFVYTICVIYLASISNIIRYALPAYPILILFSSKIIFNSNSIKNKRLLTVFIILTILLSVYLPTRFFISHIGPDTRVQTHNFLQKISSKNKINIAIYEHHWSNPYLKNINCEITKIMFKQYGNVKDDRANTFEWFLNKKVDYFILNSFMTNFHTNKLTSKYYPKTTNSFKNLYKKIEINSELVYTKIRPWYGNGPNIRIYKVKKIKPKILNKLPSF